jgi:hypothetical protein
MSMNGQEQPISVDLGGALFADGAGVGQVIASLPRNPIRLNLCNFLRAIRVS